MKYERTPAAFAVIADEIRHFASMISIHHDNRAPIQGTEMLAGSLFLGYRFAPPQAFTVGPVGASKQPVSDTAASFADPNQARDIAALVISRSSFVMLA
jgi:hypothetical protein